MTSNLLAFPLQTTHYIPLADPLRELIARDYFQASSLFADDLNTLDLDRRNITDIPDDSALKTYHADLVVLEEKFPRDCLSFAWYTAKGHVVEAACVRFERVHVLYNLAALASRRGASGARVSEATLKLACAEFQLAAGFLSQARELSETTMGLPAELEVGALALMEALMLAQAQETIWQKAVATKMKDSIIARLAMQTSQLYEQANKGSYRQAQVKLKADHFFAAAHLRASAAAAAESAYGVEVGHLRVAMARINQANTRECAEAVVEDYTGLKTAVASQLVKSERDNDLIYHLPEVAAAVPAVLLVKPVVYTFPKSPLFGELLPYVVLQVAQGFRERQDSFIADSFADPIHSLNQLLVKFLTERNLPASVDAIHRPETLPLSVVARAGEIKLRGGLESIRSSLNDIQTLSAEAEAMVHRVLSVQGDRPTKEVSSLLGYISQAQAGDRVIVECFRELKPYLELFCGDIHELEASIPQHRFLQPAPAATLVTTALQDAVNEAKRQESERGHFLEAVEIKSRERNVLARVIEHYRALLSTDVRSYESVYEAHIQDFEEDLKQLALLRDTQIELEREINLLNTAFVSGQASAVPSARQEALQRLDAAYTGWVELVGNISQGLKFYNDFLGKVNGILRRCEEKGCSDEASKEYSEESSEEEEEYISDEGSAALEAIPLQSPQPVPGWLNYP